MECGFDLPAPVPARRESAVDTRSGGGSETASVEEEPASFGRRDREEMELDLRLLEGRRPIEPTPAAMSRWRRNGIAIPLKETLFTQSTSDWGGDHPPGETTTVLEAAGCDLGREEERREELVEVERPIPKGR